MKNIAFILLAAAASSIPAFAVDGVVLINQSTVMAAGGFPYTISQPGSYRLSGNLALTTVSAAIVITASNVTLDLNGFSISDTAPLGGGTTGLLMTSGAITGVTIRNGTFSSGTIIPINAFSGSGMIFADLNLLSTNGGGVSVFGSSSIIRNVVYPSGTIEINCQTVVADSVAFAFHLLTPSSPSCSYAFGVTVGPLV
jgi:hypothetical protein